jgi:hypothetical protein
VYSYAFVSYFEFQIKNNKQIYLFWKQQSNIFHQIHFKDTRKYKYELLWTVGKTLALPHHFTKTGNVRQWCWLTPPCFSLKYLWCTVKVWGRVFVCQGYKFCLFLRISTRFGKCFDSVIFVSSFIETRLLSFNLNRILFKIWSRIKKADSRTTSYSDSEFLKRLLFLK